LLSYGFRPGRGTHDALDALCVGIHSKKVSFILDADIQSFLDSAWFMSFDQRVRIARFASSAEHLFGPCKHVPNGRE
jgi:hypothetical protein